MSPSGSDEYSGPGEPDDASNLDGVKCAIAILRALTTIARGSRARQADLSAAVRAAGLPADPPRVQVALKLLQSEGCVANVMPRQDGSLLLSVTRAKPVRLLRRLQGKDDGAS